MFDMSTNITSIKFNNTKSMKLVGIINMFYGCSSLVSLDLSNWDTSSLTNAEFLFYGCNKLTHIKCKQTFKDWCITKQNTIRLPTAMREGGSGTWEIIV